MRRCAVANFEDPVQRAHRRGRGRRSHSARLQCGATVRGTERLARGGPHPLPECLTMQHSLPCVQRHYRSAVHATCKQCAATKRAIGYNSKKGGHVRASDTSAICCLLHSCYGPSLQRRCSQLLATTLSRSVCAPKMHTRCMTGSPAGPSGRAAWRSAVATPRPAYTFTKDHAACSQRPPKPMLYAEAGSSGHSASPNQAAARLRCRSMQASRGPSSASDIFCFDLSVLCDTHRLSTEAAWAAAGAIWPHVQIGSPDLFADLMCVTDQLIVCVCLRALCILFQPQ